MQNDNQPQKTQFGEGFGTYRTRRKMSRMLSEWYGPEEGPGALVRYLPRTQPIAEVMRRVAEKKLPLERMRILRIREEWAEIAGELAAKRTDPLRFDGTVLHVEIAHPAYLAAFNSKRIKDVIVQKITELLGEGSCTGIVFVPVGGRPGIRKFGVIPHGKS